MQPAAATGGYTPPNPPRSHPDVSPELLPSPSCLSSLLYLSATYSKGAIRRDHVTPVREATMQDPDPPVHDTAYLLVHHKALSHTHQSAAQAHVDVVVYAFVDPMDAPRHVHSSFLPFPGKGCGPCLASASRRTAWRWPSAGPSACCPPTRASCMHTRTHTYLVTEAKHQTLAGTENNKSKGLVCRPKSWKSAKQYHVF